MLLSSVEAAACEQFNYLLFAVELVTMFFATCLANITSFPLAILCTVGIIFSSF